MSVRAGLSAALVRGSSATRSTQEALRGVVVLRNRGMFSPLRLDQALAATRAVAALGPVAGAVTHGASLHPRAVAIIDERGPMTYSDLDLASNALARALIERRIGQGNVVALLARDHRGLVLSLLAAAKVGARTVLMNTGFAAPQLAEVARREQVRAVLYDNEFEGLLTELPSSIERIRTWTDDDDDAGSAVADRLIAEHSQGALPRPSRPGGLVLLTSGTTGTPKGAPRERVSVLQSAAFLDRIPLPSQRTMVMAAPIFHGTGLSQFILGLGLGSTVVLRRRFDAEATVASIAELRAHTLVLVPTMLQRILELGPEVLGKYDTSSLKIIFSAGSALPTDLCARTATHFGAVLYNLYGSTEVAVALVATPKDLARAPGTVGRPPLGCRVALIDDSGNVITRPHVVGRIFAGSTLSFGGYTDGRHKEIIDGLLSSGDVGHFDENGLWFVDGRDDEMIVSGGENVYPLEVENLLSEREDVIEAAVIGIDDPEFGQRLRAYIVLSPTGRPTESDIKDYVKANLARYKVPKDVVFVESLPRNATGKLLRRQLSTN